MDSSPPYKEGAMCPRNRGNSIRTDFRRIRRGSGTLGRAPETFGRLPAISGAAPEAPRDAPEAGGDLPEAPGEARRPAPLPRPAGLFLLSPSHAKIPERSRYRPRPRRRNGDEEIRALASGPDPGSARSGK